MKINFVSRKSLQYPYTLYNEKYHLCEKIGTGFDYRIDGYVINENENLICKKGKLSEFNTMNQKRKFNFFGKNGFWVESSSLSSFGSYPPLMSSLFGVRYLYTNEPISYGYEFLNDFSIEKDTYFVYENPNALSLGFAFDEHTYQTPIEKNPFLYQNSFVQYLTGNSIFSPVSYEKIDKKTFKIKIDYSFPIYLYYDGRYDLDIFIDNEKIDTHKEIKNTGYIKQGIVYVGNKFEKGEVIIRFLENIDDKRFFLYYLNEEKYSNTISQLRQNPVHITSIKKNILKGNIDLDEGKDVLFTIPYSKHYTVLVDDKPVKVLQRYNLFLGFRVEKGFHTMEIVYQNKLVYIGVFISLICFFGSVVFSIYTKRGAKREK